MIQYLKNSSIPQEHQLKNLSTFSTIKKKPISLGKMYLSPKVHKNLYNVRGRPVISNCDAPPESHEEL